MVWTGAEGVVKDATYWVFDIGGTCFRFREINESGAILSDSEEVTNSGDLLGQLEEWLKQRSSRNVLGIGVSLAGITDPLGRKVEYAPNVGLADFPLADWLTGKTGVPALVHRDTVAAAWGEKVCGLAQNLSSFVYVSLGTGIGGAIVLEDRVFTGSGGIAGHFGHMTIDLHGTVGECGMGVGCAEDYASGRSLQRLLAESYGNDPERPKNFRDLIERFDQGDSRARSVWQAYSNALASLLCNVVFVLSPSHIILGGGLGANNPDLVNRIRPLVEERIDARFRRNLTLLSSQLGNQANLWGAYYLIKSYVSKKGLARE